MVDLWRRLTPVLLGVLLALAGMHPLPARAELPAPDQLLRLDDRLMRARRVRITTPSGSLVAGGVRASVEGLAYRNILSSTGGGASPIPSPIRWEDAVRIDVPSNHALAGMLVTGVVVGGIAGWGVYSAGQQGNDIGGGGIALLGVPVIAVLGAVVGAHMPSWHAVYRKRLTPADRR
jgi:hypothetical protein